MQAPKKKFSSTYIIAVASRAIQDAAVLRNRAEEEGKKLPTFTLEAGENPDGAGWMAKRDDFRFENFNNGFLRVQLDEIFGVRTLSFLLSTYGIASKEVAELEERMRELLQPLAI
ncbi:MAG: hypothetical protein ACE5I1_17780 [bacterium]